MIETILLNGAYAVSFASMLYVSFLVWRNLWRKWRRRNLVPSDFDRAIPIISDAGTGGYTWPPGQDQERLASLWLCSRINEWLDHPDILGVNDYNRSLKEEEFIRDEEANTGAYYVSFEAGRSIVNIRISRSASREKAGLYQDAIE